MRVLLDDAQFVSAKEGDPMRSLVSLYLTIGIALLLVGFLATGPCPDKNTDVVSDVVFIVGWPVYLFDDVVRGNATAPQWLHRQACEGGVVADRAPSRADPPKPD
jgi:hypothetical protein